MDTESQVEADRSRLHVIRERIRELARDHARVAESIRQAYRDFQVLHAGASRAEAEADARKESLAREVLMQGWFSDRSESDGRSRFVVRLHTPWKTSDIGHLEKWRRVKIKLEIRGEAGRFASLLDGIEHRLANVALESLRLPNGYADPKRPDHEREASFSEWGALLTAGTHQNVSWTVEGYLPVGEADDEPVDPHSLDSADLARFDDAEYLTIALYHLGGLADTGSHRPIVPKPDEDGDIVARMNALCAWRARFPVRSEDMDLNDPPLSPLRLPVRAAEQMLMAVERWVGRERAARARRPHRLPLENPLIDEAEMQPQLLPLVNALSLTLSWSIALPRSYSRMIELKATAGLPGNHEWPGSPEIERDRADHEAEANKIRDEHAEHGKPVIVTDFHEPEWTEAMREWSDTYRSWCAAIRDAKSATRSREVAGIMDIGEDRPANQWTSKVVMDLDSLAALLHPTGATGPDGLGLVRFGLPAFPTEFHERAQAIERRLAELRAVGFAKTPPSANRDGASNPQKSNTEEGPKGDGAPGGGAGSNPKATPPVGIELRGKGEPPVVGGKVKDRLTPKQYDLLYILIGAGETGISGNMLVKRTGSDDAVNMLKRLARKDADWKQAIPLPGAAGMGYRAIGTVPNILGDSKVSQNP